MAGLCWRPTTSADPIMDQIILEEDHPLNDPDLLQAMEIFMGMSPSEREEAIHGLMDAIGDDPKKHADMEYLIKQLPALDAEHLKTSPAGMHSNLEQMVQDDEVAKAKKDARQILDGTTWEFFWVNQAAILENTIASGQLSPADAARFMTDEDAWKKQLRIIWEDVTSQQEL